MPDEKIDIPAKCTEIFLNFDFKKLDTSLNYLINEHALLFKAKSAMLYRKCSEYGYELLCQNNDFCTGLNEEIASLCNKTSKGEALETVISNKKEQINNKITILNISPSPNSDGNVSYAIALVDGIELSEMQLLHEGFINTFVRKLLEDCEERRAFAIDTMTGALSRNEFEKAKERIKKEKNKQYAVSFIDIFDLKTVNDTYGHDSGDRYIKGVANAIRKHVIEPLGKDVLFYRPGGDEFVILWEAESEDSSKKKSEIIMEMLEEAKTTVEQNSNLIVGYPDVTSFDHGESFGRSEEFSQVLMDADERMYANKEKHKKEKMKKKRKLKNWFKK